MASPRSSPRSKTARRIALGVLGFVAVGIAALAAALIVLHTDWGRDRVREQLEDQLAETFAGGGTIDMNLSHGAGAGTFGYQMWFRNQPASYCNPEAFNLSNGLQLTW